MKKRNWGRVLFARGIKKNYLLLLFSLPPAQESSHFYGSP
jgi:hypothetical protein